MPRVERILLEFDPGTAPVSGRMRIASAAPVPFTGWTALFAALRTATEPVEPQRAPASDHDGQ